MRKTPAVTAVLRVLLEERHPAYGLAIAKVTGLNSETVYRTLARLEDEAWVTSRLEKGRRMYTLTEEGRTTAEAWFSADPSHVSRYRRRATFVRAIRWLGTNWDEVSAFVGDAARLEGDVVWIRTVHGEEPCRLEEWVIEGVQDFYPVPQEVFDATYEVP